MIRTYQATFAAGELAPELLGRLDLTDYLNGVKRCRNMIVRPQGSLVKRPGFRYVGQVKDSTKRTRLLPFRYGAGQNMLVEFGEGYFRFWRDQQPLRYINARLVSSVDPAALSESLSFAQDHLLSNDQGVRLFAGPGGALPAGLTEGVLYAVRWLDERTIQLAATVGGPAINLTSSGAAPFYVFSELEEPPAYVPPSTIASVSVFIPSQITTATPHLLATGDPITLVSNGGVLPTSNSQGVLREGVVYYAYVVSPTVVGICLTLQDAVSGAALTLTAAGSGVSRAVHKYYPAGQLVRHASSPQGYFRAQWDNPVQGIPGTSAWQKLPVDGTMEVANFYAEDQLFEVTYDQSFDVMTLAHGSHPLRELRRYSDTVWEVRGVALTPTLPAPAGLAAARTFGSLQPFYVIAPNQGGTNSQAAFGTAGLGGNRGTGLQVGDLAWLSLNSDGTGNFGGVTPFAAGAYVVVEVGAGDPPFARFRLKNGADPIVFSTLLSDLANITYPFWVRRTSQNAENSYQVTAVHPDGTESLPSAVLTVDNDLDIEGAFNTLTWGLVPGAKGYRVYRKLSSVFGLIGETTSPTLIDRNAFEPDAGRTPPIADDEAYGNPGVVARHEQRRVLGDLQNKRAFVVASRTGTESDFTYRQPQQPTDRLALRADAKRASQMRHLIGLDSLLGLTDDGVFRFWADGGALTAETATVRFQDGIGASRVRPEVVGRAVLFVSRAGRLQELQWRLDAEGFIPIDLTLRAPHLFEDRTPLDFAFAQAPLPLGFMPNDARRLLGVTYVPSERVGAWHWHDTPEGFSTAMANYDSVASLQEGADDVIYAIVRRRNSTGEIACIERLDPVRTPPRVTEERFVDSYLAFDGRGQTSTLTIDSVAAIGGNPTVQLTCSASVFVPYDVGRSVAVRSRTGRTYMFRISVYDGGTVVRATMLKDGYEVIFGNTTGGPVLEAGWSFAQEVFDLPWLQGCKVYALADGVPRGPFTCAAGTGRITLPVPAVEVSIGLVYPAEVELLPPAAQADGLTRGRGRSVSEAAVRVLQSGGFFVGPNFTKMAPQLGAFDVDYSTSVFSAPPPGAVFMFTKEAEAVVFPDWQPDATLALRQTSPLPLRLLGVALKVQLGD